jgi:hypothetical protein
MESRWTDPLKGELKAYRLGPHGQEQEVEAEDGDEDEGGPDGFHHDVPVVPVKVVLESEFGPAQVGS